MGIQQQLNPTNIQSSLQYMYCDKCKRQENPVPHYSSKK